MANEVRLPFQREALRSREAQKLDVMFIRNPVMEATVGIHDHERSRKPQSIQVNLDIALPGSSACFSAPICDTIDYSAVVESIGRELGLRRFYLLEALAECVARLLRNRFGSPLARVEVGKEQMIPGARLVGVLIDRAYSGEIANVLTAGAHR